LEAELNPGDISMNRIFQSISFGLMLTILLSCQGTDKKAQQPHLQKTNPSLSLSALIEGNTRFASAHSVHPDESLSRSHEVAESQHPIAVVITCSDSRVSPELVFDEGIGDIFVIRTAGNIIGEIELGSVEYAVEHLEVPLVVVLGHERCGAVKALVDHEVPHGHLQCIIDSLSQEPEILAIPANDPNRLESCIRANINHGVNELLQQSSLLSNRVKQGTLKVIGARYDLDDRTVSVVRQ
jgi:carbonic anhydrase